MQQPEGREPKAETQTRTRTEKRVPDRPEPRTPNVCPVTKRIDFCYGHRLLDYDGVCKHPHGHNASVEIEVRTDRLDKRNMVRTSATSSAS